jgi:glutathione S-transferase
MKLYRFRYSPYARKVQALLDLMGARYDLVEVSYGDREEMASISGGWVQVPVFVDDDGTVVVESRTICERLVAKKEGTSLVPSPFEGPIWAYSDFVDGALEDVLFRIASPAVRDAWKGAFERGLYVFVKERKFGAGCIDAWQRDRDGLALRAKKLLEPTMRTFSKQKFLFGERPTLADAALYGNCAMLEEADPALLARVDERLVPFMRRVEQGFAARG